ncbi:MAG: hypothetical protein A2Y23_15620 [Clostridiales bacterium GWB2_37_7]|nr:MAG: hypothetical protein A2Y23_15620 [Clostridiales bacterium GWB2_37_7]
MKRLFEFALISVLIATLTTGCTQKTAEPTVAEVPKALKDGTYTAVGTIDQTDWIPEITLTIAQGKIASVEYDETAAIKKSENIDYQKSFKLQKNIDLLAVYANLQNSLIKNQDVSKIDTIAGATKSVENFKTLTASALSNAMDGSQYKDGDYSATGVKDDKNWTPIVTLTVKAGKITAVKYDEISSKVFKNKSLDIAYLAKYKEESKLDLAEVYNDLQMSLIEKQNTDEIDVITGATLARDNFVKLAAEAMQQAK